MSEFRQGSILRVVNGSVLGHSMTGLKFEGLVESFTLPIGTLLEVWSPPEGADAEGSHVRGMLYLSTGDKRFFAHPTNLELEPDPKIPKFRGTIVVEHNDYIAFFFLGWKKYRASLGRPRTDRGADHFIGNVGVAYETINLLNLLGHKVHIIDESEDY